MDRKNTGNFVLRQEKVWRQGICLQHRENFDERIHQCCCGCFHDPLTFVLNLNLFNWEIE